MVETTVFKSNRSQAVRLPKAVELPEGVRRVEIIRQGQARIITPAGTAWDAFFEGADASVDFLADREQPAAQDREGL